MLHIGITKIVESMTLKTSIAVVNAEFGKLYEKCQMCQFFHVKLTIYATVRVLTFL
jgi:hypothetical protein